MYKDEEKLLQNVEDADKVYVETILYKDKSVSKYRFRIITKAKQFFLYKDIYFARDKEVEIPKDLQKRIVEVIEDWVDEKEQELKNI